MSQPLFHLALTTVFKNIPHLIHNIIKQEFFAYSLLQKGINGVNLLNGKINMLIGACFICTYVDQILRFTISGKDIFDLSGKFLMSILRHSTHNTGYALKYINGRIMIMLCHTS